MSNVKKFVDSYYNYAKLTEAKTGISTIAILAQAAVESAWGRIAPGNMFFGIKDTDGVNGNEQLLITTEYLSKPDAKFPVVISVQEVIMKGKRMWKYRVKDWFRKYKTPEESFTDHAKFFYRYSRYNVALNYRHDPYRFIEEIAKAGYATAPNYSEILTKVAKLIESEINNKAQ